MTSPESHDTYRLIQTPDELSRTISALSAAKTFYLDTEFEAARGRTTLSLLQLSSGREVFLIDALSLRDLSPLRAVLAAEGVEWVLHAGQHDVDLVQHALGSERRPRVFDTQVAWSLLGPEHSVSLAYLVYRLLGKRSAKGHQTDDWMKRPLQLGQLAYAASDVAVLPAMATLLEERLAAVSRTEIARLASAEQLWPQREPAPKLELEQFRNAWLLGPREQACLLALIDWFNELPDEQRAAAPETKVLLAIAARAPANLEQLERLRGVPPRWAAHHGPTLLTRMQRAAASTTTGAFRPLEPVPYATFEEVRIDAWLQCARAELCSRLGVAPELGLPARVMKRLRTVMIAEGDELELSSLLEGWRHTLFAPLLRQWVASHPVPPPPSRA